VAVSRVTVHHEGAGAPIDFPRGAEGGYSVWIGTTKYTILRSPYDSWGTYHYNHVSYDICLSGNRNTLYHVTNNDIALIRAACADARARGWLTGWPDVVAHKYSLGSSTECPGDRALARWNEIVNACHDVPAPPPAPVPAPKPKFKDEEMLIVNCAGKPAVLLIGNAVRSIHDPATLHGLQDRGIPSVTVSAVDYDNLTGK
jgi:hypothetical protein